jgi:hypothetical protein
MLWEREKPLTRPTTAGESAVAGHPLPKGEDSLCDWGDGSLSRLAPMMRVTISALPGKPDRTSTFKRWTDLKYQMANHLNFAFCLLPFEIVFAGGRHKGVAAFWEFRCGRTLAGWACLGLPRVTDASEILPPSPIIHGKPQADCQTDRKALYL